MAFWPCVSTAIALQVWHKGCFRCTVCNMALSMKNYKGFDKMPYCEP